MKRFISVLSVLAIILGIGLSSAKAQQKSVLVLIKTAYYGAADGFPSYIKDTLPVTAEGEYRIKPEIVNQFAGIKDITIKITANRKYDLNSEALYNIYNMKIISDDIAPHQDLPRNTSEDSLLFYYKKAVNFFTENFGNELKYSGIIRLQNLSETENKPSHIVYFYANSISLPDSETDINEIEHRLDVAPWFTLELWKSPSANESFYIVYRISGGKHSK